MIFALHTNVPAKVSDSKLIGSYEIRFIAHQEMLRRPQHACEFSLTRDLPNLPEQNVNHIAPHIRCIGEIGQFGLCRPDVANDFRAGFSHV